MHRSGTSFLSRALNLRGTYLGQSEDLTSDDFRSYNDNLRGHWESSIFLKLTNDTLQKSGGAWDNIPKKITIDGNLGNEIKEHSHKIFDYPSLASGFKDPRIIFCLESWEKFLPPNLVIVGIYRHPLKVAESLKLRNNFSYEKSIDLWSQYNEKLLSMLEKYPGFLLNFDWQKEKLFSEIDFISESLGLSKTIQLDEWYTNDLKRSDTSYNNSYSLNDKTVSLLLKLEESSNQNSEVRIPSVFHTNENLHKIIDGLLKELNTQHNYFRKIHTTNIKTIEDLKNKVEEHKKTIEELKKTDVELKKAIDTIHNTPTWKTLNKINQIRKKFKKI